MKTNSLLIMVLTVIVPGLLIAQTGYPHMSKHSVGMSNKAYQPEGTRSMGMGGREGMSLMGLAEELGITEEQLDKFNTLRLKYEKETAQLKTDLRLINIELKSLWMEKELDKDKIIEKVKARTRIMGQLAEKRAELRIQKMNILTADQRKILNRHKALREMHHRCWDN